MQPSFGLAIQSAGFPLTRGTSPLVGLQVTVRTLSALVVGAAVLIQASSGLILSQLVQGLLLPVKVTSTFCVAIFRVSVTASCTPAKAVLVTTSLAKAGKARAGVGLAIDVSRPRSDKVRVYMCKVQYMSILFIPNYCEIIDMSRKGETPIFVSRMKIR